MVLNLLIVANQLSFLQDQQFISSCRAKTSSKNCIILSVYAYRCFAQVRPVICISSSTLHAFPSLVASGRRLELLPLCDVLVVPDCARAEPTKDTIILESEKPQEDVRKQPTAEAVAEDRVTVSRVIVIS